MIIHEFVDFFTVVSILWIFALSARHRLSVDQNALIDISNENLSVQLERVKKRTIFRATIDKDFNGGVDFDYADSEMLKFCSSLPVVILGPSEEEGVQPSI